MKISVLIAGLLVAPVPAFAAEEVLSPKNPIKGILSPEEFKEFATGSTLYFTKNGQPFGAEHYFEDGRVIWSFMSGKCDRGAWFENEGQICFAYESQSSAQCWHFFKDGEKHRGRVVGADPEEDLTVAGRNSRELTCDGPGVNASYQIN